MESMSLRLLILKTVFFDGSALPNTQEEFSVHKNPATFLILGVAVTLIILKDRKIFLMPVVFGCLTASYFIGLFWNSNVAFSCYTQILEHKRAGEKGGKGLYFLLTKRNNFVIFF